MFENSFQKLARISSKHSIKVLIIWLILLFVLLPFASLLFSQTSYNLASSVVPPNSMATRANNLQSEYFPSNSTNSSAMAIVTTGTSVTSNGTMGNFNKAEAGVVSYLQGQGIKSNFTSIVSIENSSLIGGAKLGLGLVNGTYPLIQSVSQMNATVNMTIGVEFGLPAIYLDTYNSTSYNRNDAFNKMLANSTTPLTKNFTLSFAQELNTTSVNITNISNAINYTVRNQSSNFSKLISKNQNLQYFFTSVVSAINFGNYLSAENAKHLPSLVKEVSIPIIKQALPSKATKFIVNDLNISVSSFIGNVLNLTSFNPHFFQNLTALLVAHGVNSYFYRSPFVSTGSNSGLQTFIKDLNNTKNIGLVTSRILLNDSFSNYPILPARNVYNQFIGTDNSTVIFLLDVSVNLSVSQISKVHSIFLSYLDPSNVKVYVAGAAALDNQIGSETLGGMERALIIGIALSIVVVGIFFRSVTAAFLPLTVFGFSAAISLAINGLLYKYVLHATVSFVTPTLLLILLLGLSSDYSVYIMARYRREMRHGNPDPVSETGKWAGHAVFTSGFTVAISYVVLYLSHVPIMSDAGITNAIGVVVAILVANTLLIAIISHFQKRVFGIRKEDSTKTERNVMAGIAHTVVKNKGKIVVVFLILSLVGGYFYFTTPTNMNVFSLIPSSSGVQAIDAVNSSFNGDFFDRGFIVIEFPSPVYSKETGFNTTEINQVTAIENKIIETKGISEVFGPTMPFGTYVPYNYSGIPSRYVDDYLNQSLTFVGTDSRYIMLDFQLSNLAWLSSSSSVVSSLPGVINSAGGNVVSTDIGGLTQGLNDAFSYTSSSFDKMVPILCIAIFAILLLQLGSVFTPIRLILMVLASVVISLVIAYAIDIFALSYPIIIFLPLFTVVTLLAVGLDYDIFMVARVREEVIKGRSDTEGIRTSITENGGVITTLGILLFVTFGSLVFSDVGIITEMGIGLALGVLVDTFVSWPFFVPAIMLYLEKYNWWPSKLSKRN
ncbi:MAG: MMPL family transporter [Thermoplasmatales archaeon]|nr:MMPL family transporter [Thermoplasmatales archaeon]MCW6170516.1 MMPL family transporter [Thermoplasmatales archaeon]